MSYLYTVCLIVVHTSFTFQCESASQCLRILWTIELFPLDRINVSKLNLLRS